jgi:hypothetical protein
MKSLYEEEAPAILKKIEAGIKQRIESVGPDETVGVLEFIKAKILNHKGEYIRLPKIPIDLAKVDQVFLKDLFKTEDEKTEFYKHLMYQNWTNRFGDLINEDNN